MMHKIVFIYLVVINIVGIYIMYSDKRRAKRGEYRISEATLWRVAIFGGAIGTTIGMHWFRHKTRHSTFRFGFPLLAVIDVIFFVVLFH